MQMAQLMHSGTNVLSAAPNLNRNAAPSSCAPSSSFDQSNEDDVANQLSFTPFVYRPPPSARN
jgi:hypothetical protein